MSSTDEYWRQWCRLCAKNDTDGNIGIFENDVGEMSTSLPTAIGSFFWINVRPNDDISISICQECVTLLIKLTNFRDRVNKVQSMYCELKTASKADVSIDPEKIREQYCLTDEDRGHIINNKNDLVTITTVDYNTAAHEDFEQLEEETEIAINYVCEDEQLEIIENEECEDKEELTFEFTDEKGTALKRVRLGTSTNKASDTIEEDINDLQEALTGTDDECDENELLQKILDKEFIKIEENNSKAENEEKPNEEEVFDTKINDSNVSSTSNSGMLPRGRPPKRKSDVNDSEKPAMTPFESTFRYICRICTRKYKNLTSYRKHMLETHSELPDFDEFECDKCSETFPSIKQLNYHKRKHMPMHKKLVVPCPYCKKKFSKVCVMKQHVNGIHLNERPFICDECGNAVKTLAALNEHKLVHTNVTPYECDVCHKLFKNKARLKMHSDVHTETNYVCNVCGMQLNTRRTLKMHMLVHTDNKQYQCDFCDASFKRAKSLKNHLLLHSGLRPYSCNFCGKNFSNGSNCRSHKKKTHPAELAAEEAMGIKQEPTTVPKLDELRAQRNIVAQRVKRHKGGLSLQMRQLLLAAEQRTTSIKPETSHSYQLIEQDSNEDESVVRFVAEESDGNPLNLKESKLVKREQSADDDDEETIIFEVIDQVEDE